MINFINLSTTLHHHSFLKIKSISDLAKIFVLLLLLFSSFSSSFSSSMRYHGTFSRGRSVVCKWGIPEKKKTEGG